MDSAGVAQGAESAFPKAEYDGRVARARRLLEAAGIDVMIVTGPENIFYLTGQQTPGFTPSRHWCCRSTASRPLSSVSSNISISSPTPSSPARRFTGTAISR